MSKKLVSVVVGAVVGVAVAAGVIGVKTICNKKKNETIDIEVSSEEFEEN